MVNVGFIGTGNMGTAIIKGIASSSFSENVTLFATDIDKAKIDSLGEFDVSPCETACEIVKRCKYVFLAVKPQMFDGLLAEISPFVTAETVLISIAAGITAEYIKAMTIPDAKVVLVMPNTPLLLGEGASALSKAEPVTDEEFKIVLDIFSSCGTAEVIDKDKMKEIIAINGSSPAFIYLFAKGFIDYAVSVNIAEKTAKELFSKTLIGSARMITDSGYSIDELIKMVSSPGGTTLKGLDELYKGDLTGIVSNACKACTTRAYELSK
ncbi:MAG: pyrroline-5-carboxylate reductase [Oscillospiraceae bacterium]|jgi:pyrroline-5-carboxylate reductase